MGMKVTIVQKLRKNSTKEEINFQLHCRRKQRNWGPSSSGFYKVRLQRLHFDDFTNHSIKAI